MKALILLACLMAATVSAFGQSYAGAFGTIGISDGAFLKEHPRNLSYGAIIQARWQINRKWFLSGEAAFRTTNGASMDAQLCYECYRQLPVPITHNQISLPILAGYYLSKPSAKTRLWMGLGGEWENCNSYFTTRPYSDKLPSEHFQGLYLQNAIGLDIMVKRILLRGSFHYNSMIWCRDRTSYVEFNGAIYQVKRGLFNPPRPGFGELRMQWAAWVPITAKADLTFGLDAFSKNNSIGYLTDLRGNSVGTSYYFLGLNAGVAYWLR